MQKSRRWLNQAKQLCEEPDADDGVDPRCLAKKWQATPKSFKSQQFCKEAKQVLSLVLAGDLSDPVFESIYVADVSTNSNGQYLRVTIASHTPINSEQENQIIQRLASIQGYLRAAIARSVNRKRVPGLNFRGMQEIEEGKQNAYSENN